MIIKARFWRLLDLRLFRLGLLGGGLLAACAAEPYKAGPYDKEAGPLSVTVTNDTTTIQSGAYISPAWVNEAFEGTHDRVLEGHRLTFKIHQTVDGGGWDAGLSPADVFTGSVSDVPQTETLCFSYTLDLETSGQGKWWVGPKISVNWAAMTDVPSTGEWYENYVVEAANQTPQDLEADLFDYFEAEFLGENQIAGARYRHVKLKFQDWWQYWSIRQDYRMSGQLTIRDVLDAWTGLPDDLIYDGVKANIETHGPVDGEGLIVASTYENLTDLSYCK